MVEKRTADAVVAFVRTHPPPAVDQQHDALVPLVLELANHGFAGAPGCLPVDVANRIPGPVFGELVEIGAFASALIVLDAQLGESAVPRQPGVASHLGEVGKHAARLPVADPLYQLTQAESRPNSRRCGLQRDVAAARGCCRIRKLQAAVARDGGGGGEPVNQQRRIDVVEQLAAPVARAVRLDEELDVALHPDRQSIRKPPRQAWRGSLPGLLRQQVVRGGGCEERQCPNQREGCSGSQRYSCNQPEQTARSAHGEGPKRGLARDDSHGGSVGASGSRSGDAVYDGPEDVDRLAAFEQGVRTE